MLVALASVAVCAPKVAAEELGAGIIFVGASWCPVCHKAAPLLKAISDQLNVPVLVASGDAKPIAPFSEFVPAAGHPLAAEVREYPTVLIYSAAEQKIVATVVGYRRPQWFMQQVTNGLRLAASAGGQG